MKYITRELETEINPFLNRKEALAILGPRQAGKTTLLLELQRQLEKRKKRVKYITFENRSDLNLFEKSIDDFKSLYKDYDVVILDEFHYAKEAGQKLKYLVDTTKIKFIVSGSSSLELVFKTGKYMVGRLLTFHLWPFSFLEFVLSQDKDLYKLLKTRSGGLGKKTKPCKTSDEINDRLSKHFDNFIVYGGYPAVALEPKPELKKKILAGILENFLLKDIKDLLSLASDDNLLSLARFLAIQAGNLVNYQELANTSDLSLPEVKKHLKILEQTFIIKIIRPFYSNKRLELVKTPKVYFLDSGFRNLLIDNFNPLSNRVDKGALVENFVAGYLTTKSTGLSDVRFWRTKSQAEVDFIWQKGDTIIPIEVKYSSQPTPGKSLHSFIDKFSPSQALVLTKDYTYSQIINKTRVDFTPVYYL